MFELRFTLLENLELNLQYYCNMSDSELDLQSDHVGNTDDVMTLFASGDSEDDFSGFTAKDLKSKTLKTYERKESDKKAGKNPVNKPESSGTTTSTRNVTVSEPPVKKGGKSKGLPGSKAPMKKVNKRKASSSPSKSNVSQKQKVTHDEEQYQAKFDAMFDALAQNLSEMIANNVKAKKSEEIPKSSKSAQSVEVVDVDLENEPQEDTQNDVNLGTCNIFSDNESHTDEVEEFEFEMPKIFEDDAKFGDAVSEKISGIVKNVCKKKSEVGEIMKQVKIPINCKDLVPPPVNQEIWNFLEKKVKSKDLNAQLVQRLLGLGLAQIVNTAETLKASKPDIKLMRTCVSSALTILCNAFFEMSVLRRMFLRFYIDSRYHQLCGRSEEVGNNLFGDDVSKRLKEISETQKMNKTFSNSKNYRGRGYHQGQRYQGGQRFMGRRPYQSQYRGQYQTPRRPYRGRGNPRFQRRY